MATETQKEYYRKWRQKNKTHVRKYEKARRDETNSRKRARRKVEKKYGKGSTEGKSVDHINGNPKDNRPSNLRIVKNYHGYRGKGYGRKKKGKK